MTRKGELEEAMKRVLIIAGSDPSGGAGIQADIKTVTALGGFAMAAITSLTVQNTVGVSAVHAVEPEIIRDQIVACLSDIGADAVKIGMVGGAAAGEAIVEGLARGGWRKGGAPLVVDPVLAATSGDSLASADLLEFMRSVLLPLATIATPNADEAAAIVGAPVDGIEAQNASATMIRTLGADGVLVKGAHIAGGEITDLFVSQDGSKRFVNPRIGDRPLHGTGCTLSSAIATRLAQGASAHDAIEDAISFVRQAIRSAGPIGRGARPLNHANAMRFAED